MGLGNYCWNHPSVQAEDCHLDRGSYICRCARKNTASASAPSSSLPTPIHYYYSCLSSKPAYLPTYHCPPTSPPAPYDTSFNCRLSGAYLSRHSESCYPSSITEHKPFKFSLLLGSNLPWSIELCCLLALKPRGSEIPPPATGFTTPQRLVGHTRRKSSILKPHHTCTSLEKGTIPPRCPVPSAESRQTS